MAPYTFGIIRDISGWEGDHPIRGLRILRYEDPDHCLENDSHERAL